MNKLPAALASTLLLSTILTTAHATQVVDDFESGTNPNEWGWTNGGGGAFTIQPDGGNPGAWLDTSAVNNCHPVYDLPSNFTLVLSDLHTIPSVPPTVIEAHTTDGPVSPTEGPFPWTHADFTIPSGASDVPPGWVLNVPPDMNYTWADLMQNIDGISFFVINPEEITFDSCWQLGADNVVVTYGDADAVFDNGFEGVAR